MESPTVFEAVHYVPSSKPKIPNGEWLARPAVCQRLISIGVEVVGRLVDPLIMRHGMGVGIHHGPGAYQTHPRRLTVWERQ